MRYDYFGWGAEGSAGNGDGWGVGWGDAGSTGYGDSSGQGTGLETSDDGYGGGDGDGYADDCGG